MLAVLQRQLIYQPTRVSQLPISESGFRRGSGEEISLPTPDGLQLGGWHILPSSLNAAAAADFDRCLTEGRKVVLFFHGNGGHRGHRDLEYQLLTRLDVHVIAFDYRGYGENAGQPTEENFASDAREMWKYLNQTRHVAPERIILYGESLGSGVATRLASELSAAGTPPGGLILISPFSSLIDAAGYHYPWLPVSWLLKDRYRSDQYITRVNAPLLILHGTKDSVVPINLGRKLFELAPERSANGIAKTFVELPRSDHNDILLANPAEFEKGVAKFLMQL